MGRGRIASNRTPPHPVPGARHRGVRSPRGRWLGALLGAAALAAGPAQAASWDGWYAGLRAGEDRVRLSTGYEHRHIGNCVNLNFGSGWPGDNCEGSQDYTYGQASRARATAASVEFGHLWTRGPVVLGVAVGVHHGPRLDLTRSRALGDWGDTLEVGVRTRESASLRAIVGMPGERWLPFASLGVVTQRAVVSYRQEHQVNYDLPVSARRDSWGFGPSVGVGARFRLDADWSADAEWVYQRVDLRTLSGAGTMVSGGLRYPDTDVRNRVESSGPRLGVQRRF